MMFVNIVVEKANNAVKIINVIQEIYANQINVNRAVVCMSNAVLQIIHTYALLVLA